MRAPRSAMAVPVAALLCACGGLDNGPLERGDLVGRVLRADQVTGRAVLMGAEPQEVGLDGAGGFRFSQVPTGAHELLIVASDTEALRVPAAVRPAEVSDLQELDPLLAAFIVIDLTTQGRVEECWVQIPRTHLREVHAPAGSSRFLVGPLGAGCYEAAMLHDGRPFWSQEAVCLEPGERRAFDVSW